MLHSKTQVSDWTGEARDTKRGGPSHKRDIRAGEEPAAARAPGWPLWTLHRGGELKQFPLYLLKCLCFMEWMVEMPMLPCQHIFNFFLQSWLYEDFYILNIVLWHYNALFVKFLCNHRTWNIGIHICLFFFRHVWMVRQNISALLKNQCFTVVITT